MKRFQGDSSCRSRPVSAESWNGFGSYPLRKDYPLQGRGERHNFPVIRRGEA